MSIKRAVTILSFAGTLALAYISSADPQLESSVANVTKEPVSAGKSLSRNRWKLGGSVGFTQSEKQTNLSLFPSAQFFIYDRVAVGLEAGVSLSDWNLYYRSLRPSASYYFLVADEYDVFFKQDIGYSQFRTYSGEGYVSAVDASSRVGLDWFFNQNVALTPMTGADYGRGTKPTYVGTLSLSVFL